MTDDPTPQDDEEWTLEDENHEEINGETLEEDQSEAAESLEDAGESLEDAGEALEDETYEGGEASGFDKVRDQVTKRDFIKGTAAGAAGVMVLGAAGLYAQDRVDSPEGPGVDDLAEGEYALSEDVTVDLGQLDSVYENSSVVMGVQEDGDLIAWNTNVQNPEGQNPLWRFNSSDFPDREHYNVEGEHPVTQVYNASDADIESMTEDMVNVFNDGDDWEAEADYKEVDFQELKDGLVEYGGTGQAQDYFFNRTESLKSGNPTLEREWQELLQDGR